MKALLFDLDGVLVDTSQSYDQAILRSVEQMAGLKRDISDVYRLRLGGGYNNDWELTEALLKEAGKDFPYEEIVDVFQKLYFDEGKGLIRTETWLAPKQLLETLAGRFKLGIVTGRPRLEAEYTVKKSGTRGLFTALVTMDDVQHCKPDPEGIFLALEELECSRGWYLGDNVDDCRAATAAGLQFFGVIPPKHRDPEALRKAFQKLKVQKVLDDVSAVLNFLS